MLTLSQWMLYLALSMQIAVDGSIAVCVFILLRRYNTGIRRYLICLSLHICKVVNIAYSLDVVIKNITLYIVNTGALSVYVVFEGRPCDSYLRQTDFSQRVHCYKHDPCKYRSQCRASFSQT